MRILYFFLSTLVVASLTTSATAQTFELHSTDISEGQQLPLAHVFNGFGCEGSNVSPQLSWSNPPTGTKSFAITAYDPDAPTGSGWWHWNVVNIPASVTFLDRGVSNTKKLPESAVELRNDYSTTGFGGACPPPGEVHRYIFTIYALDVENLDLPKNASNALVGFMTRANALATARITAVYNR